jgi:hypothetical protein
MAGAAAVAGVSGSAGVGSDLSPEMGGSDLSPEMGGSAGAGAMMSPGMAGGMADMSGMSGGFGGGMQGAGMPQGAGGRQALPQVQIVDVKPYAHAALERNLGLIAETLKAELTNRVAAGQFGAVLPTLEVAGKGLAPKLAFVGVPLMPPAQGQPLTWVPGVDYIGVGPAKEIIPKAKELGYELLFHFDVIAKEARSGEPQYDARLRLVNCATGESIAVSRTMSKRDVLTAAKVRGMGAILKEAVQPVFDAIDGGLVLRPLPPLQATHAASRIDLLMASPNPEKLEQLAEIAMFHRRKLIDDKQLDQLFYFAAGEDGLKLLHDTPENRMQVAQKMVAAELALDQPKQ